MDITICSREDIEKMLKEEFPKNTAVISFYDPDGDKVYYTGKPDMLFQIPLYDIDIDELADFGLTEQTYFPEAEKLAEFIYNAKENDMDLICQCEHGQSRSSACAAAVLEHFSKSGMLIFSDYNFYPNRLVYNKVYTALNNYKDERNAKND